MPEILKRYKLKLPLWLIPMLYVGVTVVGGLILPSLEHEYLATYSHAMSVGSALATLSAIASGMIALTGIVFAIPLSWCNSARWPIPRAWSSGLGAILSCFTRSACSP